MPYRVEKKDDKWCVVSPSGRVHTKHSSKEAAEKEAEQMNKAHRSNEADEHIAEQRRIRLYRTQKTPGRYGSFNE
jgi:hypothetical protein